MRAAGPARERLEGTHDTCKRPVFHNGRPDDDAAIGAAAPGRRPVQGWEALTASDVKVARLIAQGHTNRSAADLLVVSPHTVNTHLTAVFRKLAVNSRVQLANLVTALPDG
ncbi:helix-turn-helix domain-containing protein [Streptomyces bungoensis]|uniref:helix-turn-helix domain-containing protein n=1 Tax=Streptomyces bungoensis TaxID=285568 RepID=UPI003F5496D9